MKFEENEGGEGEKQLATGKVQEREIEIDGVEREAQKECKYWGVTKSFRIRPDFRTRDIMKERECEGEKVGREKKKT